jgi:hypothetical protein
MLPTLLREFRAYLRTFLKLSAAAGFSLSPSDGERVGERGLIIFKSSVGIRGVSSSVIHA